MGGYIRYVAVLVSVCLGGCAKYQAMPLDTSSLEYPATQIQHPLLKSIMAKDGPGITPDQAGIVAVIANPELRAQRDQRQLADAQLIQAGILPNPQLAFSEQIPNGGASGGSINAYDIGVNWEITSLISHDAKVRAGRDTSASVDLDIAWQEWQTAQAARLAAMDVIALQAELDASLDIEKSLTDNASIIQSAVDRHEKTSLDLAAAQSASQDAHESSLAAARGLSNSRLLLNRALGLPPQTILKLRGTLEIPEHLKLPSLADALRDLEQRRLDIVALKMGYQSQEETLRAAVLQQFPKISIGVDRSRDNSDVKYLGPGITLDLPIFDRNQGNIATEKATRQKLFDEYNQRVFEARSDVAQALDELEQIEKQIDAAKQSAEALKQLVDTYRAAMQSGNLDVISYYSAQNSMVQKNLDILKLKAEWMSTLVQLEIASGEIFPLDGSSTQPSPAMEKS